MRRWLIAVAVVALGAFLVVQLVPYGWSKSNPEVTAPAPWPNAQAESIARAACYACHSNETEWPVYSYVAPMSWLVRSDVDGGRREMNFSEWDEDGADAAEDARDEILDGAMPPPSYRWIHRDARMTDEEAAVLIAALEQMAASTDD